MAAKIKKGDLVEVVRGRTSDSKKMNARNARRDAEGLELAALDQRQRGRHAVEHDVDLPAHHLLQRRRRTGKGHVRQIQPRLLREDRSRVV